MRFTSSLFVKKYLQFASAINPVGKWFDHDDRFSHKRLPALGNLDDVSPTGSNFASLVFLAITTKADDSP